MGARSYGMDLGYSRRLPGPWPLLVFLHLLSTTSSKILSPPSDRPERSWLLSFFLLGLFLLRFLGWERSQSGSRSLCSNLDRAPRSSRWPFLAWQSPLWCCWHSQTRFSFKEISLSHGSCTKQGWPIWLSISWQLPLRSPFFSRSTKGLSRWGLEMFKIVLTPRWAWQ